MMKFVNAQHLMVLLSSIWLLGGCASFSQREVPSPKIPEAVSSPSAQPELVPESQSAVWAPPAKPAKTSAPTQSAAAPLASQTSGQYVGDIQQVGFRLRSGARGHISDDCGCQFGPCADNDGIPCQNETTPAMPFVPQPWYYDPQEFLCDGGDQNPDATLTRDDRIIGLQAEDTVTHFTTENGDIEFAASNRVCVYSPRFGSVRRITGAILNDRSIAASGMVRPVGPISVDYDQPGLVMTDTIEVERAEFTRRIDSMRDRNRGVRIENIQQLEMAGDVLAVLSGIQHVSLLEVDESQLAIIERLAIAANEWTIGESVEVEVQDVAPPVLTRDQKLDALVVYEFPDAGRLNLIKLADKQHAAIGEEVSFALRLQNVGDSPVSGVVVTDNLTTRLEYVVDSQKASVKADFETKLNDASSEQLIWHIQDEIKVGESVTIEFKCRVR